MCLCVNAWGGCWSALAVVGVVCWCDARLMLCVRMCMHVHLCVRLCVYKCFPHTTTHSKKQSPSGVLSRQLGTQSTGAQMLYMRPGSFVCEAVSATGSKAADRRHWDIRPGRPVCCPLGVQVTQQQQQCSAAQVLQQRRVGAHVHARGF